jgi:hypothetical protein
MNMPFSNQKQEGFENRIADLIAKDLGAPPTYVWWGQRRGFIRNTIDATLEEGRCDIVIGVPAGYDLVATTRPYYRSTYVFVYPKGKGLAIRSLDDPALKKLKIGVHLLGDDYTNPPPVHELSKRGIVENVVGFRRTRRARSSTLSPPGAWTWRSSGDLWPGTSRSRAACRWNWCASRQEKAICRSPSTSRWG